MPSLIKYSAPALHDQQVYKCIKELPDGSIITFDQAYFNYQQFAKFQEEVLPAWYLNKLMQTIHTSKNCN